MRVIVSVLLIVSMMIAPLPPFERMAYAAPVNADLIDRVYRSTALLYAQTNTGNLYFACTATVIAKMETTYRFLTSAHCIGEDGVDDNGDPVTAVPNDVAFYVTFDQTVLKFYPAELVGVGLQKRGDDFALFEVESDEVWPTMPLGDESKDTLGSSIINVSIPMGVTKQVFQGSVTQMKINRRMIMAKAGLYWQGAMLVSLPGTAPGSSGSVVVSVDQQAITGVLVGVLGSAIVVLPVSRFKEFYVKILRGQYPWYRQ
jgi:hypothetical protein